MLQPKHSKRGLTQQHNLVQGGGTARRISFCVITTRTKVYILSFHKESWPLCACREVGNAMLDTAGSYFG